MRMQGNESGQYAYDYRTPLPNGRHPATIEKADLKSKAKGELIRLRICVDGPNGGTAIDHDLMSYAFEQRVPEALIAIGRTGEGEALRADQKADVDILPKWFLDAPVWVEIKNEDYRGKPQPRVEGLADRHGGATYAALPGAGAVPAGFGDDSELPF